MHECEQRGMEAQSRSHRDCFWRCIQIVTKNRMTNMFEMKPQLMAAPGPWSQLKPCTLTKSL